MVQSQAGGLTISRFAAAGGVGVETVRFYQRNGLLPVPVSKSGVRRYTDRELRRLRFIRQAQSAGFTLAEIGELLVLDAGHDHGPARSMALTRIKVLDERIAALQEARDSLKRLARQCAGNPSRPCPILSAFDGDARR
jgi:MerR family transcriptional regulator, mercuric resistance operon regulatory protein